MKGKGHLINRVTFDVETDKDEKHLETFKLFKSLFYQNLKECLVEVLDEYDIDGLYSIERVEIDLGLINMASSRFFSDSQIRQITKKIRAELASILVKQMGTIKNEPLLFNVISDILEYGYSARSYLLKGLNINDYFSSLDYRDFDKLIRLIRVNRLKPTFSKRLVAYLSQAQLRRIIFELFPKQKNVHKKLLSFLNNSQSKIHDLKIIDFEKEMNIFLLSKPDVGEIQEADLIYSILSNSISLSNLVQDVFESSISLREYDEELIGYLRQSTSEQSQHNIKFKDLTEKQFFESLDVFLETGAFMISWFAMSKSKYVNIFNDFTKNRSFFIRQYLRRLSEQKLSRFISISENDGSIEFMPNLVQDYNFIKRNFVNNLNKLQSIGLISFRADFGLNYDILMLKKFINSSSPIITVDKKFFYDFLNSNTYDLDLRFSNKLDFDLDSDSNLSFSNASDSNIYIDTLKELINSNKQPSNLDQLLVENKVVQEEIKLDTEFLQNVILYIIKFDELPWWAARQINLYFEQEKININIDPLSFSLILWKDLKRSSKSSFKVLIKQVLENRTTCEFLFFSDNNDLKNFILDSVLPKFYTLSVSAFIKEFNALLKTNLYFSFNEKALVNNVCSTLVPLLVESSPNINRVFNIFILAYSHALNISYQGIYKIIADNKSAFKKQLGLSHKEYSILLNSISPSENEKLLLVERIIDVNTEYELRDSLITKKEFLDSIKEFIDNGYFSVYSQMSHIDFIEIMSTLNSSDQMELSLMNMYNRSIAVQGLIASIAKNNNEDSIYKSIFLEQLEINYNKPVQDIIDVYIKELKAYKNTDPLERNIHEDFISSFETFKKENIDNNKLIENIVQEKKIDIVKRFLSFLLVPDDRVHEEKIFYKGLSLMKVQNIKNMILSNKLISSELENLSKKLLEIEFSSLDDIRIFFHQSIEKGVISDDLILKIGDDLIEIANDLAIDAYVEDDLLDKVGLKIDSIDEIIISHELLNLKESKDVVISIIEYFLYTGKFPWWSPFSSEEEVSYYFNKLYNSDHEYILRQLKRAVNNDKIKKLLKIYLNRTEEIDIAHGKLNNLKDKFRKLTDYQLQGVPDDFKSEKINWIIERILDLFHFKLNRNLLQRMNTAILQFSVVELGLDTYKGIEYFEKYLESEDKYPINDFKIFTENSINEIYTYENIVGKDKEVVEKKVLKFISLIQKEPSESFELLIEEVLNFNLINLKPEEEIKILVNGAIYLKSLRGNLLFSDYLLSLRRNKNLIDSVELYDIVLEAGKSQKLNENTSNHSDFFMMIELLQLITDDYFSSELFNLNTIIPFANTLVSIRENDWGKSLLFLMLEAQAFKEKRSLFDTLKNLINTIESKKAGTYVNLREALNSVHSDDFFSDNSYLNLIRTFFKQNNEKSNSNPNLNLTQGLIRGLENDASFWTDYSETFVSDDHNYLDSLTFENSNNVKWTDLEDGDRIYVPNAGVILLWPFLTTLFRNLGYLDGKNFKDRKFQERAVYLIQYIVDGEDVAPEFILMLNKIICGIELSDTIDLNIKLSKREKDEINNFILTVKNQWKEMKNTSIEGFRETFLKREGALVFKNDKWNLKVEHKAVDILLTKLPWGLSIVKFSWNEYVIIVEWDAKN